jgi:hypothetical protein
VGFRIAVRPRPVPTHAEDVVPMSRYRIGVALHQEGEMTIHGVDDATIELAGRSRCDIREFGMEPPRTLMLKGEPEVTVRVEIQAVKEG